MNDRFSGSISSNFVGDVVFLLSSSLGLDSMFDSALLDILLFDTCMLFIAVGNIIATPGSSC